MYTDKMVWPLSIRLTGMAKIFEPYRSSAKDKHKHCSGLPAENGRGGSWILEFVLWGSAHQCHNFKKITPVIAP